MDDGEPSNGRDGESHTTVRDVVVIVLDTASAGSVTRATMPTLSEIAASGTTFEQAYSSAPWSVPSHASLFTGTYTNEHGTHGGHPFLDPDQRTLAEAFQDAGYRTVGVSNNTWITEEFGFDRGFETLHRGWQYLQSPVDMGAVVRGEDRREKLLAARERLFEGNPLVNLANVLYSEVLQPSGDDGAARSTDRLLEWLTDRDDDRPVFAFCNYIEPHVPYEPPRELASRFLPEDWSFEAAMAIRQDPRAYDCGEYDLTDEEFAALRGLYRAELATIDRHLARLRAGLRAADQWEETLLVVCSDHGENVGHHGFFGHQYNLYDTLLHVPLVVHGGPFTGGGTRDGLVQLLDLPPTLCDAAGIEDAAMTAQHSGQSLVAGSEAARESVFAEYVAPQPSIERLEARFGTLPERVYRYDRRLWAIRTAQYKYVRGGDGFERLHDLDADPNEERSCLETRPDLARDLRDRLETRRVDHDVEAPPADRAETPPMRDATKERLADLGYL